MRKPTGYIVMEFCDDYEQALRLKHDAQTPPLGVLDWGTPAALFATRADARAAIARTEHFSKAFGVPQNGAPGSMPAKKDCRITPVAFAR